MSHPCSPASGGHWQGCSFTGRKGLDDDSPKRISEE